MAAEPTGGTAVGSPPMAEPTIDNLFSEERRYPPPPEFAAQANAQPGIYERDFEEFWATEGRERVSWFEEPTTLCEWEPPYAKWFVGGKLNVAYNCVDRHVEAGVELHVSDGGEGMAEDVRHRIFDPFFASRLNNWRATQLLISLIQDPMWGLYNGTRFVCAVDLCRTHAALGEERNFLGAEKAVGLYLAGVVFGGPQMYEVDISPPQFPRHWY
jgi:hypothetical protein